MPILGYFDHFWYIFVNFEQTKNSKLQKTILKILKIGPKMLILAYVLPFFNFCSIYVNFEPKKNN